MKQTVALIDRIQTSTPSDQVLIANLLDTTPQFRAALATALREAKQQRNLAQYWQLIVDVALAASHTSNVTTNSDSSSLAQKMEFDNILKSYHPVFFCKL